MMKAYWNKIYLCNSSHLQKTVSLHPNSVAGSIPDEVKDFYQVT
jgi:hypothetical protein